MSKWRLIESAPEDTEFLAIRPRDGKIIQVRRTDNPWKDGQHHVIDAEHGRWFSANHWMPLPEPPK